VLRTRRPLAPAAAFARAAAAASAAVAAALPLLLLPVPAKAGAARLQALGGVDLLTEDDSGALTNPALLPQYSNRAWFSLGLTGGGGTVGLDPHGGASVRIKQIVTLGVVLNRSPQSYGFGRALWPAALAYMPQGPGGDLMGSDGPVETSAPLRFPVDLFAAIGDMYAPLRLGLNLYYAGGSTRSWIVDDSDQDSLEDDERMSAQTHLFNATIGVSGGAAGTRVRPQGWIRVSNMAAWVDQVGKREISNDDSLSDEDRFDSFEDRILSMDRDLRIGGGLRVHIGDPEQGLCVTPGLRYDMASGAFRFDDNMANPDSPDEDALRDALAHDAQIGVGVAWRNDGLLVQGTAALGFRRLTVTDTVDAGDDGVEVFVDDDVDLALPELSIGAEYRVLQPLLVRAGIRSTVAGGRQLTTHSEAVGADAPEADKYLVDQEISPTPVAVGFEANGGIGIETRHFRFDAILGGVFLGTGTPEFLSRFDLAFLFD
jgi:hypothetical protein